MTLNGYKTASSALGDSPRSGKWTKEESDYVDLLIAEFRHGALPIRNGTTLRSFLSKMINCNPKRVSKKYENTGYSGKTPFRPSVVPISMAETNRRRERLQVYERKFLHALKRANDDPKSEEQGKPISFDEGSRAKGLKNKVTGSPSCPGLSASTWMSPDEEQKAVAALPKLPPARLSSSRRPSHVDNPTYSDRFAAEIQSRMEAASCLSGANSTVPSASNVRDLPSSIYGMSFKPPSAFASPPPRENVRLVGSYGVATGGSGSTLHQLATFDFALKQRTSAALKEPKPRVPNSMCGLPGQQDLKNKMRHAGLVRMQQQSTVEQRAQRLLLDGSKAEDKHGNFHVTQYVCQASQPESGGVFKRAAGVDFTFQRMAELPFPSLPLADRSAALGYLSSVQIASLVSREELQRDAFAQGLSNHNTLALARQRPGSNFDMEIEMIESLKRERERCGLDNCRPFKRM
jgi:hypothetical protein